MKKILSIDGGGIKGTFVASFLSQVEASLGKRTSDYFDLIVGTSTGGIIALGIGLGFTAAELLSFYDSYGPSIFKKRSMFSGLKQLFTSKYDIQPLRNALESKFGQRMLGESRNRLVIPSMNVDTGEVHVYKTAHHERFKTDYHESAVTVGLATVAAPTYFPEHLVGSGTPLIDGGAWANNPMGVATTEALGVLKWPAEDVHMVSIGCTAEPFDIQRQKNKAGGIFFWSSRVVRVFMAAQSSAALGTAQLLLGHDHVIRVCPTVPRGRYGMDVLSSIHLLKALGETEARKALPNLESFFEEPAEAFSPFHILEETANR